MSDLGNRGEREVLRCAKRLGVLTGYIDALGREVTVSEATQRALVDALAGPDDKAAAAGSEAAPPEAPSEAYQDVDQKGHWVLAVQLYALRSRRNWGHGDFTDLRRLLEIAASHGAAGVGLNPLHALLNGKTMDGSPYSPSSRLFLNFLYIDVEALPEFGSVPAADLLARAAALRDLEQVDYAAVHELKEMALRQCFERYRLSAENPDFADFCAERGEPLRRFAQFEAARCAAANGQAVGDLKINVRFHQYVQWRADRQLRACRDRARELEMPVGLYLDLAVGVRPDGADAHANAETFLEKVSVGAPPDFLNTNGQNWGLTTFSPVALAQQSFAPMVRMLAANMRYAGALRLDHVLWLNRLYLVPDGMSPAEGGYVRYPLSTLLAAVSEQSNAFRCVVIGEDLGTVPPELRAELRRWGVWTYHVMQFERDASGQFRGPDEYQERALATFSTHDLPPFAAWQAGSDLTEKRSIGIDPGETDAERERAKEHLQMALREIGVAGEGRFLDIAVFLARTPSRLVAVGLEDALEISRMINVPGTSIERPNWRARLPVDLDELVSDPRLISLSRTFAEAGRASEKRKRPAGISGRSA